MMTVRSMRLGLFALVASCAFVLANVGISAAGPVPKVTICHLPPGNPENVQLITVGEPAVAAHVENHGDAVCAEGNSDCCPAGRRGEVCTNLASDASNCGECGSACPPGDVCTDGDCGCPIAGDTNCSGVCTDLQTDPVNCGACGIPCTPPGNCSGGACVGIGGPG